MSLLNTPFHNPDKPIIVFQFVSECTPRDVHVMFRKTLDFMNVMQAHHIFRVIDWSHLTNTGPEIKPLVEVLFQSMPGSSVKDHRITPIGSGPSHIATLYHEVMQSNPAYRRHSVPFFPTLRSALGFVRQL